ncbi:heavy-metal-associated domain-containing protein [Kocuria sediminis]|uniref:Heavy-metal-associated domain-containing protein n=2 Tax=Kocuria sediminis TaxID=1038857 RepID=A0A6N8GRH8_9MICC|nr:heavy-metal-associated domain-containing protein [Kocuria sediminis]
MNAAARLGAYAAGLAVVFTGAFAAAGAVVPETTVSAWTQQAEGTEMTQHTDSGQDPAETTAGSRAGHTPQGVSMEQNGYLLQELSAPGATGDPGELSLTITGPDGAPVTEFETSHERQMHLIVVRSDAAGFRHVHPVMDEAGRWSLPWQWEAAGTYRVYADIVPTGAGQNLTLTSTVDVAGAFTPGTPEASTTDEVDGYQISVAGDLSVGSTAELTISVTRDGQPVTTLEPYLGAYGHLVALRAGDLAYLHTHPEGAEPVAGEVSGPDVVFATTAPSPGRYYLYFDFQVDGQVHTAQFALDTTGAAGTMPSANTTAEGHGGH